MICTICNRENDDAARFCAYCGAQLSGELEPVEEYHDVAVLAAEVAGISTITYKYPRSIVAALVEGCIEAFGRIVDSYGGTITRRYGLGIEAVFGASTARENDAELASLAALNIIDGIRDIVRDNLVDKNDVLPIRCGIDFGEIRVRRSSGITAISADGTPVTNAARMVGFAPDDSILLTGEVLQRIDSFFMSQRFVGPVILSEPGEVIYQLGKRKTGVRPVSGGENEAYFGREEEIADIQDILNRSFAGNGVVCVISGETGIGKSSIVKKALEEFSDEDVFWTRNLPKGGDLSFMPFRHLLSNLFNAKPGSKLINAAYSYLSEVDIELSRYVPLLDILFGRRIIDNEYTTVLNPQQKLEHLVQLVYRIIRIRSTERPTVIVFEDAQWLDPSSARMITDLSELAEDLPVAFILVTRNPDTIPEILNLRVIDMGPLRGEDIEGIVRNSIQGIVLEENTVKEIAELTGGNPQYAREYVRAINIDRGDSDPDAHTSVKIAAQSVFKSLSEGAKTLMIYCLYTGEPVKNSILKEAMGIKDSEFEKVLEEVISPGIIELSGEFISLKTDFFKEALYSSQPESIEKDVMDNIADAAISLNEDNEVIAEYLERSSRYEEAADYWIKAGDIAMASYGLDEPLRYLEKAVGLINETGLSGGIKIETVNKLLYLYRSHGDFEKAFKLLGEELKHGKSPVELANYFKQAGIIYLATSEFSKAISFFNDSLMIQKHLENTEGVGFNYLKLSQCHFYKGDFDKSVEYAELVAESIDNDINDNLIAGANNQIALANIALFEYERSLHFSRKAYSIWEAEDNQIGLSLVYANIGLALLSSGMVDKSENFVKQAYLNTQKLGRVRHTVNVGCICSLFRLYSADFGGGLKQVAIVTEAAGNSGNVIGLSTINSIASRYKRILGDFEEAADLAEKSYVAADRFGDLIRKIDCLYDLAILTVQRGEYGKAGDYLEKLRQIQTKYKNVGQHRDILVNIVESELALRRGESDILTGTVKSLLNVGKDIKDARRYEVGLSVARSYRGLGEIPEAIETASSIHDWAKNRGFNLARVLSSALLCELHLESGNVGEAARYYDYVNSVFKAEAGPYWRDWFGEYSELLGRRD